MHRHDDAARLGAIIECQREIMACGPDRARVMRLITERTQELTCASSAAIELLEGDHMVYRAASGAAEQALGLRLLVNASFSGRCVREQRMLYCPDIEEDPSVDRAAARSLNMRSMVAVPLHHGNNVIGVLKVGSSERDGFDDTHLTTLELMTGFLSAALAHASEHDAAQRSVEMFEKAFSQTGGGMALVSLEGRWLRVNDVLCKLVGYTRAQLLQIDFQRLTHADDLDADLALVARLIRGEIDSYDMEKRYFHADGSIVYVRLSVSLVRDLEGSPLFFVSQVQDLTRAKLAESEVQAFFGLSPNLLSIVAEGASFERVNPAWTQTFGWTVEELTSRAFVDFVHPDDRESTAVEMLKLRSGGVTHGFRNRYRHQDGSYRWLEWNARSERGRIYCDARDITAQHEQEQREVAQSRALTESELRFRALSEGSIQGIMVTASSGEALLYVNEAAAKMFGFGSSDDMRAHASLFSLMPYDSRKQLAGDWDTFTAGERQALRKRLLLQRIDGTPLWVELMGSAISWGGTRALQITMVDASAQVALEDALSRQATTDALTGLCNRRRFEQLVQDALGVAERQSSPLSLLMLDLDHFKAVNDRHGHAGGDRALRAFATALEHVLGARGVAARWGGEEFVALLPGLGLAEARELAEELRTHWMTREIRGDRETFSATVSIGMTELRANDQGMQDLLERADRALYEAKRAGRNTVRPAPAGYEAREFEPGFRASRA